MAVPVPAAAELETVTVKPMVVPAETGLASAVLVMAEARGVDHDGGEALEDGALVA